MKTKRLVEVFSAGCPICEEAVERIKEEACPSCDVHVLDMNDHEVAARAAALGIRSVPAVTIDDEVAECCSSRGPEISVLRNVGLGRPIT